jgi:hypothetical protein
MNLIDRINNDSLREIAEILSDHGYNPDWKKNDRSGDWHLTHHGDWDGIKEHTCEAISIPSHDGFGEMVMNCFINECDKNKDIDYINTRWERVIFVKGRFNDLTEEQIDFLYGEED